jgi:hypothetical protein
MEVFPINLELRRPRPRANEVPADRGLVNGLTLF